MRMHRIIISGDDFARRFAPLRPMALIAGLVAPAHRNHRDF